MEKEKIVIVSTSNSKVINYLKRLEKQDGIILKLLDEKVTETLQNLNEDENVNNTNLFIDFLNLEKNREITLEKCNKLIENLCSHYSIAIDLINSVFFKISDVSRATTLSNKEAGELLALLERFGFIAFVKRHVFVFTSNAENIKQVLHNQTKNNAFKLMQNVKTETSFYKNNSLKINEKLDNFDKALEDFLKE